MKAALRRVTILVAGLVVAWPAAAVAPTDSTPAPRPRAALGSPAGARLPAVAGPSVAAAKSPATRPATPAWTVVAAQSSVSFTGTQQGEKFSGTFGAFTARVEFTPAAAGSGHIEATLDTRSIGTHNAERDQTLATADWFDTAHFPTATFQSVALRAGGPMGFIADGDLVIKGRSRRIALPFSWNPRPGGARFDARLTLDRADVALGTGEWADDAMVGRQVEVVVRLVLVPSDSH